MGEDGRGTRPTSRYFLGDQVGPFRRLWTLEDECLEVTHSRPWGTALRPVEYASIDGLAWIEGPPAGVRWAAVLGCLAFVFLTAGGVVGLVGMPAVFLSGVLASFSVVVACSWQARWIEIETAGGRRFRIRADWPSRRLGRAFADELARRRRRAQGGYPRGDTDRFDEGLGTEPGEGDGEAIDPRWIN